MPERKVPRKLNHEPEAVTWAREKSGLTRQEVAALLECAPSLITEIEQGTRNLTPARLLKLAEILNCPVVVLERKRQWGAEAPGAADRPPKAPADMEGAAALCPALPPATRSSPAPPGTWSSTRSTRS
jgi:transcriptional regulator with XRE-family HTH domain